MNTRGLIYGLFFTLLIPTGTFATDSSLLEWCAPELRIEKIAQPYVKNGSRVEFKIYVRNLNYCRIEGLTVKAVVSKDFQVRKRFSLTNRFEVSSEGDHTVVKWRNLSIAKRDFVVLSFEAHAKATAFEYDRRSVTTIACVYLQKDAYGDYDSGSFNTLGDSLNNDPNLGKSNCSLTLTEILRHR